MTGHTEQPARVDESWVPICLENLTYDPPPDVDPADEVPAPVTPEKPVRVPLGDVGDWVIMPTGAEHIDDFVTDAYVLHHWEWVDGVDGELHRVERALLDPDQLEADLLTMSKAGPDELEKERQDPNDVIRAGRPIPAEDVHDAVRQYRQDLSASDVPWVQEVHQRYCAGVTRLRQRIRTELESLEHDAWTLLDEQLRRTTTVVNAEARRYLTNLSREGPADVPFAVVRSWPCDPTTHDVKDLLQHVGSLVGMARAVVAARDRVAGAGDRAQRLMVLYGQSRGTDQEALAMANRAADAADAERERLTSALANLATWLSAKAELFPVLHRWTADDIIRATEHPSGTTLGDIIYPSLRWDELFRIAIGGGSEADLIRKVKGVLAERLTMKLIVVQQHQVARQPQVDVHVVAQRAPSTAYGTSAMAQLASDLPLGELLR